ncbi:MAG TPA: YihY/virulence factor BrkB family protein [Gaiellaceae bacterium]|jgi:membrane protein|nr:YihY/virulence factor BrkB family protein [Gaiellaceae bacterium]
MTTREERDRRRPAPDEAPVEEEHAGREPLPQPEHHEPRLVDPSLGDLSFRDWRAIVVRAGKEFLEDNGTMLASALAYSTFFAIPSVLLVVVGAFTLLVGPQTITSLMAHFSHVMPGQAASLLGGSLHRLDQHPATGVAMTVVGLVLALWSTTGAMTSYMTAINLAYERKDGRSFLRKRVVAVQLVAVIGIAFLLVAVLLIFGPPIERFVAAHAGPLSGAVGWIWWIAEWPILVVGLLAAFATLLYLGPDVAHPRWRFITPGSVLATIIWLAASGAFALYTSAFGSYNKTWGSLAAVIIMLTWLWLAAIALLLGAEINAEAERSRELREGRPAERRLLVPTRSGSR